ncbi:MFS general substrate transporter [Abortiporus biennis]|nr:MFS general substrate transporter [Abortiporus biennis]
MGRLQCIACCWALFLAGWNDGTTGPLLPKIQEFYHASYTIVSLIFVFSCLGFILGAGSNVYLSHRLGLGKVMVLVGALTQVVGYAIASPAPPFPALVLAYVLNGFGIALQDAGANGYVASLKENAETKMGILHAVYGQAGALCAPLVSTQFVQQQHWSFHYLTSLGISFFNLIFIIAVFQFRTQEECLAEIGQFPEVPDSETRSNENLYKQIVRLKSLHLLAFFILVYVGVEVTLGGWSVTYIINVRGGGPSSGYISSGFFGGLTIGRVVLIWVNKKVGERRIVFLYTVLCIGLEFVVWFVPSLIGDAVALSIIGMLLGPIYPIVMSYSSRVLPPYLLTACIGWIAGVGTAGAAALPFVTGALAGAKGIKSLQPLMVAMMSFMFMVWILIPNSPPRVLRD